MTRVRISHLRRLLSCMLLCLTAMPVGAQGLTAANTSRYLGGGRWSWTIYLVASEAVVDRISGVGPHAFPLTATG